MKEKQYNWKIQLVGSLEDEGRVDDAIAQGWQN
jgi:hypothetical protein